MKCPYTGFTCYERCANRETCTRWTAPKAIKNAESGRFAHQCPDLDQDEPFDVRAAHDQALCDVVREGGFTTPIDLGANVVAWHMGFCARCIREAGGGVIKCKYHGAEKDCRQHVLPTDSAARKATPLCTGVLDYFPRALAYVAKVSKAGNDKHNPGEPLHWDKTKSTDHADCIARHLVERTSVDPEDGLLHAGKLAWRALALLEILLEEAERG
jgi:hypothetical protein